MIVEIIKYEILYGIIEKKTTVIFQWSETLSNRFRFCFNILLADLGFTMNNIDEQIPKNYEIKIWLNKEIHSESANTWYLLSVITEQK